MTSEEILRANNVYDKILSEPLEIYNAFIEYFGEDLVDMIYPSFSKIIENYDLSDMSESKIFETIIPDLKSFNIIIRFPKVKIENEKGMFINVKDIWVRVQIIITGNSIDNIECLMSNAFTMTRSVYKKLHIKADYMHSHCPGLPLVNGEVWKKCCLGNGPIKRTVATLCSSFDMDIWKLFCIEIEKYVSTESLAGGPYRYMSSMDNNGYQKSFDKQLNNILYTDIFMNFGDNDEENDKFKKMTIDFLRYFVTNSSVPISFSDLSYCLGEDFFNFYTSISKEFIKWYNDKNNPWNTELSFSLMIEKGYLIHCTIDNNIIYRLYPFNSSIPEETLISRFQNRPMFKFKDKIIYSSIDEEDDKDDNSCYLLSSFLANFIITQILKFIKITFK